LLLGSGICGIDLLAISSPKVIIFDVANYGSPLVRSVLSLANSHGNSQKILNFEGLQDLTKEACLEEQYSQH
jgi:hypothetical protein